MSSIKKILSTTVIRLSLNTAGFNAQGASNIGFDWYLRAFDGKVSLGLEPTFEYFHKLLS